MSDQAKESKLADLLFDQVAEGYIGALEQARPLLNQVGVPTSPGSRRWGSRSAASCSPRP